MEPRDPNAVRNRSADGCAELELVRDAQHDEVLFAFLPSVVQLTVLVSESAERVAGLRDLSARFEIGTNNYVTTLHVKLLRRDGLLRTTDLRRLAAPALYP